jgi:hypothetical protein
MRKFIYAAVAAAAVLGGVLLSTGAASAAGVPANFPGNNGTSCDAWHGAPGGFGPNSPYYTVAGPQGGVGGYTFGQRQGENTGDSNSSYSAACN